MLQFIRHRAIDLCLASIAKLIIFLLTAQHPSVSFVSLVLIVHHRTISLCWPAHYFSILLNRTSSVTTDNWYQPYHLDLLLELINMWNNFENRNPLSCETKTGDNLSQKGISRFQKSSALRTIHYPRSLAQFVNWSVFWKTNQSYDLMLDLWSGAAKINRAWCNRGEILVAI